MVTRFGMASVLGAGLLAACSSHPDAMGTYVTSAKDDLAMMVQVTSDHDGQISGTVSVVTADGEGKNIAGTRSFNGTVEGKALNLQIENGTGVTLATGKLDGNNLRLTVFGNGESSQIMLTKGDAEKFDELANASRVRAAETKQEIASDAAFKDQIEQRSKTQRSIDQLADAMLAKAGEVLEKSRKMEVVISGYRAANERTAKMQNAKRSFDPNSDAGSYRISQIDYSIDGISNEMDVIHSSVQSYMQSLNQFMADATVKSSQLQAECQADRLLNCTRLLGGAEALQSRYQQFRDGYARENAAFGKRAASNT